MLLKRAPEGTGVIAGGPARAVIELAGIKNIRTKCMGSRNKQNVLLATISPCKMGKFVDEISLLRRNIKMANTLKVTSKFPDYAVLKQLTVKAMGLTKMHKTVEMPDNAATRGMIQQVQHLVKVEEA